MISVVVRRPIIAVFARADSAREAPAKATELETLRMKPDVQRTLAMMTLVWGARLIAQTAVACALVFAMPIGAYLVVGPIVGNAFLGALAL